MTLGKNSDTSPACLLTPRVDVNPGFMMFQVFTELPDVHANVDVLLSPKVVSILNWILLSGLCQGIAVFGTCANLVNIACFIKQGFKDSVDVSLFGLALSDLGSLITVIWSNICNTPAFYEADLPFDVIGVFYLTSAMPHVMFVRITAWITAFITLERCLCITIPLKIKNIMTVKRVFLILVSIFIIFIATGSPVYVVNWLDMIFVPNRNKTLLGLVRAASRDDVEKTSNMTNNTVFPFTAFGIISVCTVILVIKLQQNTKWREKSISASTAVSNRTQKVAKMVVMISLLFIACFIPMSGLFIAMFLIPGFSVDGNNFAVVLLVGGIGTILESINSSMNIFLYYRMSSKFRVAFHGLFCMCEKNLNSRDIV